MLRVVVAVIDGAGGVAGVRVGVGVGGTTMKKLVACYKDFQKDLRQIIIIILYYWCLKKTAEQITRTYPGHTTTTLDGSRSTSSTASYLSVVRRVAGGYMIGPLIILALPT